jgi:hypothetical protein
VPAQATKALVVISTELTRANISQETLETTINIRQ